MEMARRTFTGQVAEVLGEKHVAFDRSIRSNYTPASLRRQFDALGRSDRAIFEGYAAGFNAWLREVRKDRGRLLPKPSSNPQMLNPQQGWLANCNNKPAPGYPSPDMYFLSWAGAAVHATRS
jgi:acyl-homoserine lactone acylase PvdQ